METPFDELAAQCDQRRDEINERIRILRRDGRHKNKLAICTLINERMALATTKSLGKRAICIGLGYRQLQCRANKTNSDTRCNAFIWIPEENPKVVLCHNHQDSVQLYDLVLDDDDDDVIVVKVVRPHPSAIMNRIREAKEQVVKNEDKAEDKAEDNDSTQRVRLAKSIDVSKKRPISKLASKTRIRAAAIRPPFQSPIQSRLLPPQLPMLDIDSDEEIPRQKPKKIKHSVLNDTDDDIDSEPPEFLKKK